MCKCQKHKEMKTEQPEKCSKEQIEKCHGKEEGHPCVGHKK